MKVRITRDYIGGLAFAIFGTGNKINEQLIFGPTQRKVIEEGAIIEPSFRMDWVSADEFMYALKEAIREYEGSTPDFSQGELKATKYHLEDMRRLMKLAR